MFGGCSAFMASCPKSPPLNRLSCGLLRCPLQIGHWSPTNILMHPMHSECPHGSAGSTTSSSVKHTVHWYVPSFHGSPLSARYEADLFSVIRISPRWIKRRYLLLSCGVSPFLWPFISLTAVAMTSTGVTLHPMILLHPNATVSIW